MLLVTTTEAKKGGDQSRVRLFKAMTTKAGIRNKDGDEKGRRRRYSVLTGGDDQRARLIGSTRKSSRQLNATLLHILSSVIEILDML